MVTLEKVLSGAEQEDQIDPAIWHKQQTDEVLLKKLIEDHHKWTGSLRARELLDHWADSRAKFVKVFPTEYKRALGELHASREALEAIDKAVGKPAEKKAGAKAGKSLTSK